MLRRPLLVLLLIVASVGARRIDGEVLKLMEYEENEPNNDEGYIRKLEELLELPSNETNQKRLEEFIFPSSTTEIPKSSFPSFSEAIPQVSSPILRHRQTQGQQSAPQYLQVGFKTQRSLASFMLDPPQRTTRRRHRITQSTPRPGLFTNRGQPSKFIQTNLDRPLRPFMPRLSKSPLPIATTATSTSRSHRQHIASANRPKFVVALQLPESHVETLSDRVEIISNIPRSSKYVRSRSQSRKLTQLQSDFHSTSHKPFPTLATIDYTPTTTSRPMTIIPTIPNLFWNTTIRASTLATVNTTTTDNNTRAAAFVTRKIFNQNFSKKSSLLKTSTQTTTVSTNTTQTTQTIPTSTSTLTSTSTRYFSTMPTLPNLFMRVTSKSPPIIFVNTTHFARNARTANSTAKILKSHKKFRKIRKTTPYSIAQTTTTIASTSTSTTTQNPTTTTTTFDNRTVGQYAYGRRGARHQNYKFPLKNCFYNKAGYVCCNKELDNLLDEEYEKLKSSSNFHSCSIQKMANIMQAAAEKKFGTSFESIASYEDFAHSVHFKEDLACKTEIDERYILLYATAYSVTEEILRPMVIEPVRRNFRSLRRNARGSDRTHKPHRASNIARFLN